MGRSLGDVRSVTIPGQDSLPSPCSRPRAWSTRSSGGEIGSSTRRSSGMPAGRVVSRNEAEARYVIGSGEQAMAFLLERGDGYLFESPITWYSGKRKWDLSPGYERDNVHFERFVKPACLFCHSNQFDHVEGTENRYRQPIFRGHAIGCERCHGPGELHVRKPEQVGDEPPNIVNPARLKPELREAVCQQCHLQGDIRVVRAGRKLTDFRPGLPLYVHRIGVREGRHRRQDPLLRPGRADAGEPLLPREPGQDGLHLVPRPSRAARPEPRRPRTIASGVSTAMPRRGAVCRGPSGSRRAGMTAASIATCRVLRTNRSRTRRPRSI